MSRSVIACFRAAYAFVLKLTSSGRRAMFRSLLFPAGRGRSTSVAFTRSPLRTRLRGAFTARGFYADYNWHTRYLVSRYFFVAIFHAGVGLAAVAVAAVALYAPQAFGIGDVGHIKGGSLFEMALGVAIGAITFTGSIIAAAKLNGNMSGKPIMLPQRHALNIGLGILLVLLIAWLIGAESRVAFWLIVLVSFVLGVTLIIPIGGADMPVVVSMLNSYSGWAAAGIGFTLGNLALIITGSLVGSSGAILSYIMCKGMNRSFISVILGGFGGEVAGPAGAVEARPVKQGSADDAAYIMKNAGKVIIVPGYGMAVAQA